jgi:anti-sigma factor RsiW
MAQRPRVTGRRRFRGGARRLALAAILVAAGAALVIYGVAVHSRTVLLKQAEPPAAAEGSRTIDEYEPVLIREITVGGLRRSLSGELERTYGEGETPSLCPT